MALDVILANFYSWKWIHSSKGEMQLNESVSYLIEAICSTTYFPVLSLDLVETAPKLVSSTPRGMGMGYACLYLVVFESFARVGHLGLLWTSLYISFLQFWQRNRPGFAALFEILVALCFDGVSLYVFVSSLIFMCTIFLLLSS